MPLNASQSSPRRPTRPSCSASSRKAEITIMFTRMLRRAESRAGMQGSASRRPACRSTAGVIGEHRNERSDRRRDAWTDVYPGLRLAEHKWVTVGVDEAGHERPARQVVLLAVTPSERAALLERAGPNDPIALDRERVHAERIRHGQDRAAAEHNRFWAA